MNDSLEFGKFLAKSLLTEDERKDPDVMFDNGMICMETRMLEHLVKDGIITEESKVGYLSVLKLTDFWRWE